MKSELYSVQKFHLQNEINSYIFAQKNLIMLKSVGFLVAGTAISFIINHFLLAGFSWQVDLFHSFAFGLGWAMAYFLDRLDFSLAKKLGISFVGIFVLLGIGFAFFDFQAAVPSVIRFSVVFVAYYLLASFRSSKSLRK